MQHLSTHTNNDQQNNSNNKIIVTEMQIELEPVLNLTNPYFRLVNPLLKISDEPNNKPKLFIELHKIQILIYLSRRVSTK